MAVARSHRAAICARVSTLDQTAENQLTELRHYISVRGWSAQEYVDEGVSGSTDWQFCTTACKTEFHNGKRRKARALRAKGRSLRDIAKEFDSDSPASRSGLERTKPRRSLGKSPGGNAEIFRGSVLLATPRGQASPDGP